jgi:hypothetical protein
MSGPSSSTLQNAVAIGVLAVLLTVTVSGCVAGAASTASDESIRQAVVEYNRRLAVGYRSRDMSVLNGVATKDQAFTEYFHMAALGESGATLLSTQTVITFLDVRLSESQTATVLTREDWLYSQVATGGVIVRRETRVTYELTYELVPAGNGWLVNWVFETGDPRRPPEERAD